jgi:hypothetical protein
MNDIDNIIKAVNKHGYNMFVKDNTITILFDGFVKTTPLDNTLKLLYDKRIPMNINDVVILLINQHKTAKEIEEGKYDNIPSMTPEEAHNSLSQIFNSIDKKTNKDDIVKQLLYDYNFTINAYNREIFNTSDAEYLKLCNKLTDNIINRIKKIYNIL